jgi:hypothetical protein
MMVTRTQQQRIKSHEGWRPPAAEEAPSLHDTTFEKNATTQALRYWLHVWLGINANHEKEMPVHLKQTNRSEVMEEGPRFLT